MSWADVRSELIELSLDNDEYAKFNKRIVNTKQNMLGVRMPDLRLVAKGLAGGKAQDDIDDLFGMIDEKAYEEVMLIGMTIGYAKIPDSEKIELMKKYLNLVDNWAQIDSITTRKMNTDQWWDFAKSCLKSPKEFVVRFGVITMMDNFLTDEKIGQVFEALTTVKHDGYYVKMGLAWLYATAAVKYYEQTLVEVNKLGLDPWTRKKALTKMLESYRLTDEQKVEIREQRANEII